MAACRARLERLTKPRGSLGRLEVVAEQLAGITGRPAAPVGHPALVVAAADHGVVRRGVSAYPAEVTAQMVANFAAGGAAISVLARSIGASVVVLDVGVAGDIPGAASGEGAGSRPRSGPAHGPGSGPGPEPGDRGAHVLTRRVRAGTDDFTPGPPLRR